LSNTIAVYVQALPVTLSDFQSKQGKFGDQLQGASFKLSHSSKIALSVATRSGSHDITAIGHTSVLHEALARGATSVVPVPLFDNPLAQAKSFPASRFSSIIIPENLDGPFSGASLSGAISFLRGMSFTVLENTNSRLAEDCVILVKDDLKPDAIDIRRIYGATNVKLRDEAVIGELEVSKHSQDSKKREEIRGDSETVSNLIRRRLRRSLVKFS
jgi:hypothetical protein